MIFKILEVDKADVLPNELNRVSGNKQETVDPISYEYIDIVQDWIMEKELSTDVSGSTDWMAVDPPLGNVMHPSPHINDIEALGAGNYSYFDLSFFFISLGCFYFFFSLFEIFWVCRI